MTEDDAKRALAKYMNMLGLHEAVPELVVHDNLGSKWLGRAVLKPRRAGTEVWVEIQASVLEDERTLERVVAHEAVHIVEYAEMSPADLALVRMGRYTGPEHGRRFRELAKVINDEMGEDFITERSDRDFEIAENEKPFYVLIEELPGEKLGWSWAQRPSTAIQRIMDEKIARGAVLVESTERELTRGTKIRKGERGRSIPKTEEQAEIIRALWEKARS